MNRALIPLHRCLRHQTILVGNRQCTACLEEQRTGQPVRPLRGERIEDVDGRRIDTGRAPCAAAGTL